VCRRYGLINLKDYCESKFYFLGVRLKMLHQIILPGKERGVLRLELGVSAINTKAIHIYERAGFEKEGFLKKYIYFKNENHFLDDVLMAYLYE
jgi:RimJ/RimL family protein N-acetyltransferase